MVLESLGGVSLGGTFPNSFQPGALEDSFCFLENRPLANTQARSICQHYVFTPPDPKETWEQSNKPNAAWFMFIKLPVLYKNQTLMEN